MHLSDFRLHRPTSLPEACRLGKELGPSALFMAGGTDLLVDIKTRRREPSDVVSLAGLAELRGIRAGGGALTIGALTTMEELAASPAVREAATALAEAAQAVGSVQIRGRATVGGNFCAAVPCAETPPAAIALGARLRLIGPSGERTVRAEEFFTGPRATVLGPGELLAEIIVPQAAGSAGSAYLRHGRRSFTSLAVAGAGVWLSVSQGKIAAARVGLTSVAPLPLFARAAGEALVDQAPSEDAFSRAAEVAAGECRPIDDLRGSARYRRELVAVLVRRAFEAAAARAR